MLGKAIFTIVYHAHKNEVDKGGLSDKKNYSFKILLNNN